MDSAGTILRSERERQQRNVTDIAAALCIAPSYLRAIEDDDLKSLPGTFFYKSFIRQYAAVLGVPESRIRPSVEALTAPTAEPPLPGQDPRYSAPQSGFSNHWLGELKKTFSRDQSGSGVTGQSAMRVLDPVVEATNRYFMGHRLSASVLGLGAVLLVCSGFYAWWNRVPQSASERAAVSIQPAPATRSVANGGANNGDPARTAAIDVTATQTADGRAVLNLSATDEVWLSVTANGKEVFSGVLKPSQTKTLTGLEAAQMKVGNAGGLDVRWNGKAIGPIGPRGQVRTVVLTPENFEILPPKLVLDDTL
jgi:cytoskeleton protein RodZ